MIKKERKTPIKLLQLEALLRRLPNYHPKYVSIQEDHAKMRAGFKGEQSLDYYFSFLPGEKYKILHDLRLKDDSRFFQMDSLIVSSNFILIVEIKNFTGTLFFDQSFRQFTRTGNDKEESFPNPLFQVDRQTRQLKNWLKEKKLPTTPIESILIFSNSSAIIRSSNPNLPEMKKIIHSGDLLSKIEGLERKHTNPALNDKQIHMLIKKLIKENIPLKNKILEAYQLTYQDIMKGIICTVCGCHSECQLHGKWKCSKCAESGKDTYLHALTDFALLIDPFITNKQLREYLNIPSRNTANYILKKHNIPKDGNTKGTTYNLSALIEQ